MNNLMAGAARAVITPRLGTELIGYFNRPGGSQAVHDDLHARAVVLDNGVLKVALCSVELLWLRSRDVARVRATVATRCDLKPENIFIFTTHTHAGPSPHQAQNWERPLVELIADVIVEADRARQPARFGAGVGQLYGYNINRRWLHRPADPAVGVLRVEHEDGRPLAVFVNHACHAVVMGYDNLQLSGDWPGYMSRLLEADLGAVALFGQGGAGDINPLTETVRQRLAAGHPVGAIGDVSGAYGWKKGAGDAWNIGDRGGGTFIECETIGRAVYAEARRIWNGITTDAQMPLWRETVDIEGAVGPDEPPAAGLSPGLKEILGDEVGPSIPMEIMLLGLGDALLVSQPGEVFSETAIELRRRCEQMGYAVPMLVSYANGNFAYLPPANAFSEGGYEVNWPLSLGISRYLQDRIAEAIEPVLQGHCPSMR